MRASLLATALLSLVVACGDSTKPPVPTKVAVSSATTFVIPTMFVIGMRFGGSCGSSCAVTRASARRR